MNHPDERIGAAASYPPTTHQIQQQMISSILLIVIGYYAISYFDSWPSAFKRTLYETSLKVVPSHFVYGLQQFMMKAGYLRQQDTLYRRKELTDPRRKEEALRRMLGQTAIPSVFRKARTLSGYDRLLPSSAESGPPGLGNWDNSCYQNSVLQALASLPAFHHYIYRSMQLCHKCDIDGETTVALATFVDRLTDLSCQKATIWTPAVLKSMDSWQQQDAQEYFSRVADAVEKESLQYTKVLLQEYGPGLSTISPPNALFDKQTGPAVTPSKAAKMFRRTILHNPMDGMQAQALECQTCGYSEGIALTHFNCLTLSLGLKGSCAIEQLLDEYTDPELIEGVECDECSKEVNGGAEKQGLTPTDHTAGQITKDTKIKKKALRTKAKQLTLGRLPRDLVLHINRSIYDEFGNQRKNSSFIQFGADLHVLGRWCTPIEGDPEKDAEEVKATYQLKCIITHSGRHDNGHYVAYGRRDKDWYCFNDEIVTAISEEEVLRRGNVFMLFYEMLDSPGILYQDAPEELTNNTGTAEILSGDKLSYASKHSSIQSSALTPSNTCAMNDVLSQSEQQLTPVTPVLHAV